MSKTLLENLKQAHEIETQIIEGGGEVTDEVAIALELNEVATAQKIDAYAFIMETLKERGKYWDEKAALVKKYSKACLNAAERLKGNLKNIMLLENKTNVEGNEVRFVLSPMAPTLKYNEAEIPAEYFKTVTTVVLDKDKIKKTIANGIEVPGVEKIDVFALRNYPNNKRIESE